MPRPNAEAVLLSVLAPHTGPSPGFQPGCVRVTLCAPLGSSCAPVLQWLAHVWMDGVKLCPSLAEKLLLRVAIRLAALDVAVHSYERRREACNGR